MARAKKVPESPKKYVTDREIMWNVFYEHDITVTEGCEYGPHWHCSCGERDLDSSWNGHLIEAIIAKSDAV